MPNPTYRGTKDKRSQVYIYPLPWFTLVLLIQASEGITCACRWGCRRLSEITAGRGRHRNQVSFSLIVLFDKRIDVSLFLTTLGVTFSQIFRSSPFLGTNILNPVSMPSVLCILSKTPYASIANVPPQQLWVWVCFGVFLSCILLSFLLKKPKKTKKQRHTKKHVI